jgi:hypothetical protein
VVPVPKPVRITLRVASAHCDEGEGEYDQDQDDLAAGQPEFGLTEDLDGKNVEDTVQDDTSQRDCPWWDIVAPEIKNSRQSSNLEGNQESLVDED